MICSVWTQGNTYPSPWRLALGVAFLLGGAGAQQVAIADEGTEKEALAATQAGSNQQLAAPADSSAPVLPYNVSLESRANPTNSNQQLIAPKVTVFLRMIRATGTRPQPVDNSADELDIDPRLKDLAQELRKFNFAQFQLISAQRKSVEIMHRDSVQFSNGHRVVFRPTYLDDNRVGMWLKWKDDLGAPLLDTRLHFPCGKKVLAGTEMPMPVGRPAPTERVKDHGTPLAVPIIESVPDVGQQPEQSGALILSLDAKPE